MAADFSTSVGSLQL